MSEHCKLCRFWRRDARTLPEIDDEGGWGWCQRNPPTVSDHIASMMIGRPQLGCDDIAEVVTITAVADCSIHPATYHAAWCGSFEVANV